MVQSGKTIKKQLIATAKQELKEWLTMKKAMEEANNTENDSNIAMELMLLEQSILQDKTMESTFNNNARNDTALSENVTGEDKNASISVSVNAKLKVVLEKAKKDLRQKILDTLADYDQQKKVAEEKSEIREISTEEK